MQKFIQHYLFTNKERIVGLDLLRAIAILLVVYLHGIHLIPSTFIPSYIFPCLIVDGVSIFFILSGFLIGGILLKIITTTNFTKKDLLNFWIRRWFRTIPTYYFVLFSYFTFMFFYWGNFSFFNMSYVLFYQNFISPNSSVFPEIWSLCAEEWFYLSFPIFLYFTLQITKNKKWAILISILVFISFPFLLRVIKFNSGIGLEDFNENYRKIIILRLDSLVYGVIGACIKFYWNNFWTTYKKYFLFAGLLLLLLISLYKVYGAERFWFLVVAATSLESISTLFILVYLSELKTIKSRNLTFLITFISIISYSLYLLNLSFVQTFFFHFLFPKIGLANIHWIYNYIFYWVITIFLSYLLNKYIEIPSTSLREKLAPK